MAVLGHSKLVAFASIAATIFGVATLVAGSRVLLGSDPGYAVYRPLLLLNTAMGPAYIVVGILAWRRSGLGVWGAALIAVLNAAALGGIALVYEAHGPIALTSLKAMAFRTVVWVVLFMLLLWASRKAKSQASGHAA